MTKRERAIDKLEAAQRDLAEALTLMGGRPRKAIPRDPHKYRDYYAKVQIGKAQGEVEVAKTLLAANINPEVSKNG